MNDQTFQIGRKVRQLKAVAEVLCYQIGELLTLLEKVDNEDELVLIEEKFYQLRDGASGLNQQIAELLEILEKTGESDGRG